MLVIGGGDTGSDCVGTAIRQKAAKVTQIEILPQPPERQNPDTPWPAWPDILKTSSEGKMYMKETGRVEEIRADLVLLSMGFVHPVHEGFLNDLNVRYDARGNVLAVSPNKSSVEGVFIAGDVTSGPGLVVRAIDSGRKAAEAINNFLKTK